MTKILLGVALGYILSDLIDEFLGRAGENVKVSSSPMEPTPSPSPPMPGTEP